MQSPTVSFVIPCYQLARFLPECVNSILGQTYGNFEVLIMDDCSPDHTPEIARSFRDRRVRHIRNDTNLGALPNYNKGIGLSVGKYVWLISADDYLRVPYVLQRYVDLMEANPRVNYTFCPGWIVQNEKEIKSIGHLRSGNRDRVIPGRVFLQTLLHSNLVLAPAAMVRRECYERISYFPINPEWAGVTLNFIWGGDAYLWCVFALDGDVGYFAEPMVCYREHDLSSTSITTKENTENCFYAEIAVRWMVRQKAVASGYRDVSRRCLETVALEYARHLTSKQYRSSTSTVTMAQFEDSLCKNSANEPERNWIRARVFAGMGDMLYHRENLSWAGKCYGEAAHFDPWMIRVHAKRILLSLGKPGALLRQGLKRFFL